MSEDVAQVLHAGRWARFDDAILDSEREHGAAPSGALFLALLVANARREMARFTCDGRIPAIGSSPSSGIQWTSIAAS